MFVGISWEASRGLVEGSFEASWGPSGASLGPLVGLLGASGELSRASWRPLGASWAPPGAILEAIDQKRWWVGGFFLRPPVGAFKWASWGALGALLGRSWALLGPSWAPLGALLGLSWAILGPS